MQSLLDIRNKQLRVRTAAAGPVCSLPVDAGAAEQQRLAEELAKAAQYVQALLPEPQTGCIDTDWLFIPSAVLGGDAFGYHWVDDDHFALYLLDVTDHGIGAALHSVSVLNVLRAQALPATDFRCPSAVLKTLNAVFPMKRYNGLYFTIWYGVFNRKTRLLTYATGGHPPALLITEGDEEPRIARLRTHGLLVGGVQGVAFPSAARILPPQSTLYLFSDGVYEVRRADGSMLDLDTFVDLFTKEIIEGRGELPSLMDRINAIRNCTTCDDDSALLRVTFH